MLYIYLLIYDMIPQASAFYALIRYNISMPLIAYAVIRYTRFRFFKGNNEMERIEGSFETTHRTKTL